MRLARPRLVFFEREDRGGGVVRHRVEAEVAAGVMVRALPLTLALMGPIIVNAQPPVKKAEAVDVSEEQFAMAAESMRITGLGSNGSSRKWGSRTTANLPAHGA